MADDTTLAAAIAKQTAQKAVAAAETRIDAALPEAARSAVDALDVPGRIAGAVPPEVAAYMAAHPARAGSNGTNGTDGASITWRGPWQPGVAYAAQDAVSFDGSSYIATGPTDRKPPNEAWDVLAKKGADGAAALSRPVHTGGGAALSNTLPLVESGVGSAGDSAEASRGNHVHPAGGSITSGPYIDPTTATAEDVVNWLIDNGFMDGPTLPAYAAAVVALNPIAYWRLGDSSSPATDAIGSNDGIASGNVNFGVTGLVVGDADTAVAFPATPGKIVVAEDASLHTGDVLSVAYIAKRTRNGVGDEYLVDKVGFGEWYTSFGASDFPTFGVTGQPNGFRHTTAVTDTNAHLIVFTKNGATVHAYLDGVEGTSDAGTVTVSHSFAGDLWFGVESFIGTLDEVALFDYALTQADVDSLYAEAF